MLQTFLQQFVPTMEEGLTLGVPLAILFVILQRLPSEFYKKSFRTALKWGFWISIFLVAVRVGTKNAVSREILEGFATFLALVGESFLIFKLFKMQIDSEDKILKFSVAAIAFALFLYHGFELWLIPVGSIISAVGNFFEINFATKIFGFVCGIFFALILLAVFTAYIPNNIIPLCKMETMQCQAIFKPSVFLVSALIIISAVANIFFNRKAN